MFNSCYCLLSTEMINTPVSTGNVVALPYYPRWIQEVAGQGEVNKVGDKPLRVGDLLITSTEVVVKQSEVNKNSSSLWSLSTTTDKAVVKKSEVNKSIYSPCEQGLRDYSVRDLLPRFVSTFKKRLVSKKNEYNVNYFQIYLWLS